MSQQCFFEMFSRDYSLNENISRVSRDNSVCFCNKYQQSNEIITSLKTIQKPLAIFFGFGQKQVHKKQALQGVFPVLLHKQAIRRKTCSHCPAH
jgi:hypothetical protein